MHLLASTLGIFSLAVSAHELYRSSYFPAQEHIPISPFTYEGKSGPLGWYGLNTSGNALCDTGRNQSPIDILPADMGKSVQMLAGSTLTVDIPNMHSAEFENLGSTVEIPASNGTLKDGGKMYKLVQFHWHTPSEHRLNGEHYPIEQHFLFQASDESIAVVTFFLDVTEGGYTGPLHRVIMKNVTAIAKPGSSMHIGPLNFKPLLRHLHDNPIYRYNGSITSPPCLESVKWIISTKPLPISVANYKNLRSVMKFNSRYTQDGHGQENLLEVAASQLNASPAGKKLGAQTSGASRTVTSSMFFWSLGVVFSLVAAFY